jgi:hypothetical protein
MLSPFNTGAGGVTSSEILPNRNQSYKIATRNNGEIIISNYSWVCKTYKDTSMKFLHKSC